jgi:transposase
VPPLHPEWQRVFDRLEREAASANARADALQVTLRNLEATLDAQQARLEAMMKSLQTRLDEVSGHAASQNDELRSIRSLLRRRETQLEKANAEVRKLRRKLGLDDPDPDPPSAPPAPETTPKPDAKAETSQVPDTKGKGPRADTSEGEAEEPEAPPAPTDDPDVSRTEVAAESNVPGPDPVEASKKDDEQAKPPRKGGRHTPASHLPADRESYTVGACACCGGPVRKRDTEVTTVYTVVASHLRRRTIERSRVTCVDPFCGQSTTAPMPPMPCERALFDCSFIAWVVTMKFGYLMPLDRIRAMLESQGVYLAMGTLVSLVERAAELADAVDGEHMKQLKAGKYICFDGTGLKVLMPGQDKAWDGYLEVYTREDLTVFQFDLTKHADELRERLSATRALLVTDAESRNKAGAPNATFAHCNAHVVRMFDDAEGVQPELAREGRAYLETLFAIDRQAKKEGLTGEALGEARRRGRPTMAAFLRWLRRQARSDLPPSDPIRKIARYYLRHREALTRFMRDPDIPLDNNEAEREFQRHAKLRLASLFAGSVEGAHRWATLLGVARTAQKQGLDLQAYFTWLFERRGTHRARFKMAAKDLTPAAYKAAGCPGAMVAVGAIAA